MRLARLHWPWRCAVAGGAVLLAFALHRVLLPNPGIAPFVFFFAAIVLASWVGGRLVGGLTVVLSAAVGNYFFLESFIGWNVNGPAVRATAMFVLGGMFTVLLCGSFREFLLREHDSGEVVRQQAELLSLSHDAIFTWRIDGPIQSWNEGAEHLYGFTASEALGRFCYELLRSEYPEGRAAMLAALRANGHWEGQVGHTAKNGRRLTIAGRFRVFQSRNGTEHVLETAQDMTAQARWEAELRDADHRKNEFLAVLSHELRNPLAPIRSSVYVLRRAPPGSPKAVAALDIVDRQVTHMTRLVDDLLDISRISRGKLQVRQERFDWGSAIKHLVEDVRPVVSTRDLTFRVQVPDKAVWVNGDPDRLDQVVGNLLRNAMKFTPAGGQIEIELVEKGPTASVCVRDTGVGIAPEMLPHLFEPFVQAEQGLDRAQGGLGLGLALVKSIVEIHGGEVEARSRGPGQGSEFVVSLPRDSTADAPALPSSPKQETSVTRRVLIVEDNPDAATSLKEALEVNGNEVAVVDNGGAALEQMRAQLPDVVLADIGLPGMDGYALARAVRAESVLRGVSLVAVTGYAQAEDRETAFAAGFDRHVAKPVDVQALMAVLAELGLGERSAQKPSVNLEQHET